MAGTSKNAVLAPELLELSIAERTNRIAHLRRVIGLAAANNAWLTEKIHSDLDTRQEHLEAYGRQRGKADLTKLDQVDAIKIGYVIVLDDVGSLQ